MEFEDPDQSLVTILGIVAVGGVVAFVLKTGVLMQLINALL